MIDRRNKSVILMIFLAITFFSERNGFSGIVKGGWKASPELVGRLSQRRSETNYVEDKVPEYTLPNPLIMVDGTRVTDAQTWRSQRRPEILDLFRTHVYGRSPIEKPENMSFKVFDLDREALGGSAVRKQIAVYFTGVEEGPGTANHGAAERTGVAVAVNGTEAGRNADVARGRVVPDHLVVQLKLPIDGPAALGFRPLVGVAGGV